jgi:hypothetical protein
MNCKGKCECGSHEFFASQKCYHTVIVDEKNNFIDNKSIDEADDPYGPYTCIKCGKEYDEFE